MLTVNIHNGLKLQCCLNRSFTDLIKFSIKTGGASFSDVPPSLLLLFMCSPASEGRGRVSADGGKVNTVGVNTVANEYVI